MSYHSQTLTWKIIPKLTILFLLIITSFIYRIYWFIPVYTGNTCCVCISFWFCAVYPCVYREHLFEHQKQRTACGLSLCIQGTLYILPVNRQERRFIPVYTGNTNSAIFDGICLAVYPCVYREHLLRNTNKALNFGLSLCIQGTL